MENNGRLEEKLLGTESVDLKLRIWEESKLVWRVGWPAMITRVSLFGMFVVTQVFVGHIGETELASYALVQTVIMRFTNGIMLGMGTALETFCGQAYGAKQYHMMGIYMQRSWIIILICATILLPVYIFATPIFRLLGESEELSRGTGPIAFWFIGIHYYFVFNFTLQMFLQAQLKNSIVGYLSAGSIALHVLVSWILVSKLGLGINGAMASMVFCSWAAVVGMLIYVMGGWCSDTWRGFTTSAFHELWPVAKISLSSGVMLCLELWYNSILILLAGYLKDATIEISAFSICLNVTAWEFMISLGFMTSACVRVSNELGKGDAKAAKFAIKVISGTSLALGTLFFIFFLSVGGSMSYAFTSSTKIAQAVSSLMVLLSFSVLLNSIQPVLSGVAIGSGWQGIVAYVNIGCYYFIGIPLGILLGYLTSLKVKGIWIGMLCGVGTQTLVLIIITAKTDWDVQVEKAKNRLDKFLLPKEVQSNDEATTQA